MEAFGAYVVTPILKPLIERQPELQIELITDYRALSLSRREADVAIRLAEFEQHEAVVKRVGAMTFGLFASRAYLEARPWLQGERGVGHALVTSQQDLMLMPEAARLVEVAPEARIVLRANSRQVQMEGVRAGYGLALLPWYLAQGVDDVVELEAPGARVTRSLWLGVHRDTRHARRVRLVLDQLTEGLQDWAERLHPPEYPAPIERAR